MNTQVKGLPSYEDYLKLVTTDAGSLVTQTLNLAKGFADNMVKELSVELEEIRKSKRVMEIRVNELPAIDTGNKIIPDFFNRMVVNAKLGLNTLLVGPAGCGKTYAVELLASTLNLPFGHLNLTAGASETWLFGRQTPTGFVEGNFSKLYREGGVFLADEMDAADPNLMLSINTAIGNDSFYNPISGETITRHKDFVFVGAANTHGKGATATYNGRSRLDGATLDRFITIEVDYSKKVEEFLCPSKDLREALWDVRKKLRNDNSEEIISTRCFRYSYLQMMGGIGFKDVAASITSSWPRELKGVFDKYREKRFAL